MAGGILPDWLQNAFGGGIGGAIPPPQQQAQPTDQGGGFLSGLGNYLGDNSSMLMGLGAGVAQGGIGKGLELGAKYGLLDQAQRDKSQAAALQRAQVMSTYQSLRAANLPHEQALAAALNPKILEALAPQTYGKTPVVSQVEDAYGNKNPVLIDTSRNTITTPRKVDASGNPVTDIAPGFGPMGGVDQTKVGDEYLKQFPPEIQAAVKSYIAGEATPTGNPRKGFTQVVKQVAQKYGADIGEPADDTTFNARRAMRTDLAKSSPASAGGQITAARTAMTHLSDVAKSAEALGNWDVGFGPVNTLINSSRSLMTDQRAKVEALQNAAQRYGQEITKFYAASGGGEAERQHFLTSLGAAKSPQELAAVIESERRLIPGKLDELQNRIQSTLGSAADKFPVHSAESTASLKSIDATVGRMRGGAAPAISVAPDAQGWTTLPNGLRIREKP